VELRSGFVDNERVMSLGVGSALEKDVTLLLSGKVDLSRFVTHQQMFPAYGKGWQTGELKEPYFLYPL